MMCPASRLASEAGFSTLFAMNAVSEMSFTVEPKSHGPKGEIIGRGEKALRKQPRIVNATPTEPSRFVLFLPAEQPAGLDGESLWPVLIGNAKSLTSRKPMVRVFPEYGGQVAVQLGDFKIVRQSLKTKSPGAWAV